MKESTAPLSIRIFMAKERKKFEMNHRDFERFFGVPLQNFWDDVGFDTLKFDEWLCPSKGKSIRNYVEDRFGSEAAEVLDRII